MTFKEQGIDSYPLAWPTGWVRTKARTASRFSNNFSFDRIRVLLFNELKLLRVNNWNIILSTNLPLRKDGMPYSGQANPTDSGVAVYFRHKERPMVFACDKFIKVTDNLYAIAKTIEALRGIERWGASEMLERSFTGFTALPPPKAPEPKKEWWDVLYVRRDSSPDAIRTAYLRLSREHHPDVGGNPDTMARINAAYEESKR